MAESGSLRDGGNLRRPSGAAIELPARFKAFFGVTHQFAAGEAAPALTAGQTNAPDSVIIDSTYDFRAIFRAAWWSPAPAAAQCKVQFKVDRDFVFGSQQGASDLPGRFVSTLGVGQFPMPLPRGGQLIRGGSNFVAIAGDFQVVPAAASLRFLHYGYTEYARPVWDRTFYADCYPFSYMADFTAQGPLGAPVGANRTVSLPVPIDNDGDFEIRKVVIVSDGDFKLQVKNVDTRIEWFNKPVFAQLLAGTDILAPIPAGAWPFRLPDECPDYVKARGSLYVTVQDVSGFNNRIQVIFDGSKLRPAGGLRPA